LRNQIFLELLTSKKSLPVHDPFKGQGYTRKQGVGPRGELGLSLSLHDYMVSSCILVLFYFNRPANH